MSNDLSGIEELLEEIDPKKPFGDLEWDIVDNSERKQSATKYLNDKVTRTLLEDKTIRISGRVRADKYRRWADANDYKFHLRNRGNYTFIWIDKTKEEEDGEDKPAKS